MTKKPEKPRKKAQFSIYIDEDLKAKYQKIADAEDVSLNSVIRRELRKIGLADVV